MTPVAPPALVGTEPVIYGADQREYRALPARRGLALDRAVTTEWEPTAEELQCLLDGGRVRITQLTFGQALQPLKVEATSEAEHAG